MTTGRYREPVNLAAGFLRSAAQHAARPAVDVAGEVFSYGELAERAWALGALLRERTPPGGPPLTAVFAHRSPVAYTGVLAALLRGHGYVPLNRTFPDLRTSTMLERSDCRAVVVDRRSLPHLPWVLERIAHELLIVAPELDDTSELAARWPQHVVAGRGDLPPAAPWSLDVPAEDSIAYLLFTSGSTGQPKGVMVAHRNVVPLVRAMTERYGITEHDRCSQTFDLTFDLSVFDMFVTWERGACLHCLTDKTLLKPGRFIEDHELTVWFSVPSTAIFMRRFGMLKPDRYRALRWSLFCGEALTVEVAEAWSAAAPNSVVENLYGPTEATIACTVHRWDPSRSPSEARAGIVPIGRPTPGMSAIVVDTDLVPVAPGSEGELLVAGPQISLGYLDDPDRTAAAFVVPPGQSEVHYRTGDRVLLSSEGQLCYLGRLDRQVQIHGHRVELGEVEAAIRDESGFDGVVAMAWPVQGGIAGGIVAFIGTDDRLDVEALRARLGMRLPDYMIPRRVELLSQLPLNSNGKFDLPALLASLEETS